MIEFQIRLRSEAYILPTLAISSRDRVDHGNELWGMEKAQSFLAQHYEIVNEMYTGNCSIYCEIYNIGFERYHTIGRNLTRRSPQTDECRTLWYEHTCKWSEYFWRRTQWLHIEQVHGLARHDVVNHFLILARRFKRSGSCFSICCQSCLPLFRCL